MSVSKTVTSIDVGEFKSEKFKVMLMLSLVGGVAGIALVDTLVLSGRQSCRSSSVDS